MNEYMRLVAEDAKKAEDRPIYGNLLTDLSNFAAMIQILLERRRRYMQKLW